MFRREDSTDGPGSNDVEAPLFEKPPAKQGSSIRFDDKPSVITPMKPSKPRLRYGSLRTGPAPDPPSPPQPPVPKGTFNSSATPTRPALRQNSSSKGYPSTSASLSSDGMGLGLIHQADQDDEFPHMLDSPTARAAAARLHQEQHLVAPASLDGSEDSRGPDTPSPKSPQKKAPSSEAGSPAAKDNPSCKAEAVGAALGSGAAQQRQQQQQGVRSSSYKIQPPPSPASIKRAVSAATGVSVPVLPLKPQRQNSKPGGAVAASASAAVVAVAAGQRKAPPQASLELSAGASPPREIALSSLSKLSTSPPGRASSLSAPSSTVGVTFAPISTISSRRSLESISSWLDSPTEGLLAAGNSSTSPTEDAVNVPAAAAVPADQRVSDSSSTSSRESPLEGLLAAQSSLNSSSGTSHLGAQGSAVIDTTTSSSSSASYRTSKSGFPGVEEIAPVEITADISDSTADDLRPAGPSSTSSSSNSSKKDDSMTSSELLQMFMADAVLNVAEAARLEQQLIQQQQQLERQIKLQAAAQSPRTADYSSVHISEIQDTGLKVHEVEEDAVQGEVGVGGGGGGGGSSGNGSGSGSSSSVKRLVPPGSSSPLPFLNYQLTPKALIVGLLVGMAFALLMQRLALVMGVVPGYQVRGKGAAEVGFIWLACMTASGCGILGLGLLIRIHARTLLEAVHWW